MVLFLANFCYRLSRYKAGRSGSRVAVAAATMTVVTKGHLKSSREQPRQKWQGIEVAKP
jgi:hypothetical protein